MNFSGRNFHDVIAELSLKCFQKLPKTGKPKDNEWTVLSCVVSEQSDKLDVVALGTGTKCIGENKMSADGDILNDSHAEVICRRAFLRYLYENMIHDGSCLLTYDPEKELFYTNDCKFHFFTTHVPCGDAAIFAKQDSENFGKLLVGVKERSDATMYPDNKRIKLEGNDQIDISRTGAKCLKQDSRQDLHQGGINFHITGAVRTKPGRGDRTLSVSCSDKLAKWSHLGVQGALMNILLPEPIYFSSITIAGGTPYDEKALQRALFGRLGNPDLQHPYYQKEIVLGQSSLKFTYGQAEGKSPCSSSIVWFNAVNNTISKPIEVAVEGIRQGVTKKRTKSTGALQICKRELFKKFIRVIKQYRITSESISTLCNLSYREAKLAANEYQKAWLSLKKSFKLWSVKDENLLNFHIQPFN